MHGEEDDVVEEDVVCAARPKQIRAAAVDELMTGAPSRADSAPEPAHPVEHARYNHALCRVLHPQT